MPLSDGDGKSDGSVRSKTSSVNDELTVCFGCNAPFGVDDKTVRCKRCKSKFHTRCSKKSELLADGVYSKCCSAVTKNDLKLVLSSCMRELREDIVADIRSEIKAVHSKIDKLNGRVDDHDSELRKISNKVTALESSIDPGNLSATGKEEFFVEIEERRKRASNIIVYDLPKDPDGACDLDVINVIFKKVPDFPVAISAHRFGVARDDKPEPLKVSFASSDDALQVLKNKDKLIAHTEILVKNDLTPTQLSFLKFVQQELSTRIKNGEKNITIKFVKGIPRIVLTKQKPVNVKTKTEGKTKNASVKKN